MPFPFCCSVQIRSTFPQTEYCGFACRYSAHAKHGVVICLQPRSDEKSAVQVQSLKPRKRQHSYAQLCMPSRGHHESSGSRVVSGLVRGKAAFSSPQGFRAWHREPPSQRLSELSEQRKERELQLKSGDPSMPGIPGGGACGHGTRDSAFGILWEECVRIWACEHSRLAFGVVGF